MNVNIVTWILRNANGNTEVVTRKYSAENV